MRPRGPVDEPAIDLDDVRQRIDSIDDALLSLLAERADIVSRVARAKRARGLDTVDPERENAVLQRALAKGAGRFPRDGVLAVFREIISASVSMQATVSVAFLGPLGTFSHVAARTLFGASARYADQPSIEGVLEAVRHARATFGVVPLESSSAGTIPTTIDGLLEGGCVIRREVVIPVEHHLLSLAPSLADLKRVSSKTEVLAQCRSWLARTLPHVEQVQAPSSAAAVAAAAADASMAAIGSALAGELYRVPVLERRIHDQAGNQTRFVMIGTRRARRTGLDRTTLAFSVPHVEERGGLRRGLSALEAHGVDILRVESRPSRTEPWRYVHVIDVEGHVDDAPLAAALAALEARSERVRVLGSYPRYPSSEGRAGRQDDRDADD